MDGSPLTVGAVDIGTNSVRLLITADAEEVIRQVVVTGIGKGVDTTGRLDEERIDATVQVLAGYGETMDRHGVIRRRAVATSATRDAANRDLFLDRAEEALGVRPETIPGDVEAELSFRGATTGGDFEEPVFVVDIGGGSTEIVGSAGGTSVDIGSVRLTDRIVGTDRPLSPEIVRKASEHTDEILRSALPKSPPASVIGVAGTWTSLMAMALDLPEYQREQVHLAVLTESALNHLVDRLAGLAIDETERIPSLDPARATVILGGAIVASRVIHLLGVDRVTISEHDLLDGVAASLLT